MNKYLITEINLIVRLFRCGLLKYFDNDDVVFYITDLCYDKHEYKYSTDKVFAMQMQNLGILKVVSLDSDEMKQVGLLYQEYKPKFTLKTISALIYSKKYNIKIVTEDDLLKETGINNLGLKVFDKNWLIGDLVNELRMIGVNLEIDLIHQLI